MSSRLNPYIGFDGTAREAMEFYRSVLGGTLTMSTFGEYGMPEGPGSDGIMHAQLETDAGYTLMASDTPPGMEYTPGSSITISLSGDDADAAARLLHPAPRGRHRHDAAGEADVGRRVRPGHRPVRRRLARQHRPAGGLSSPGRGTEAADTADGPAPTGCGAGPPVPAWGT